jgi:CDP-glucose 4,6-dehydratase
MGMSAGDFWRRRSVLVTGATGLLGSWLVEHLLARGARVTCLIRDQVPQSRLVTSGAIARTNVVHGDLEDYLLVLRALNEYEVDTVFHLGAQTIVGTAARSPLATFEANVRGTWNLLEACRACPRLIERVLVASSDKAYGPHDVLPYTEDTPLQGRAPYDVSKSCADLIATSYFHTYRTPLAIARCGNLFGGGDLNFNRLIPGTIRSALRDEAPVVRSDGTLVRDYLYVGDAVTAYARLAESLPAPQVTGEAFNFAGHERLPVLDVVSRILGLSGKSSLVPTILDEAAGEIPRQYLDCTKAAERLRWRPAFSLDAGLRETIAWYQSHLGSAGT